MAERRVAMIIPRAKKYVVPTVAAAWTAAGAGRNKQTPQQRKGFVQYLQEQEKEYEKEYGDPGSHAREWERLYRSTSRGFGQALHLNIFRAYNKKPARVFLAGFLYGCTLISRGRAPGTHPGR